VTPQRGILDGEETVNNISSDKTDNGNRRAPWFARGLSATPAAMLLAATATVFAVPRSAYACGSTPQVPPCNVPRCIDGIWYAYPLQAGTSCGTNSYCDGGIIDPGIAEPQKSGYCIDPVEVYPKFSIQSIIYMPPGKQSSVSYGMGSSEGSRIATQTTTSAGVSVQINIFGIGLGGNYQSGVVEGHAMAVTKIETFNRTESVNTNLDLPVRGTDTFDIWVENVKLLQYYSTSNGWEFLIWTTTNGLAPEIFSYTANELSAPTPPEQDTPPGKVRAWQTLSAADKQAILSMDAPLNGAPLDPNRYQFVNKQNAPHDFYGPDNPGDPITSFGYTLSYNTQYDSINGSFVNESATVMVGFDIEVIKFGTTVSWTQTTSDTRTTTVGWQKTASLTLKTPTIGCYMDNDVYIDAAFGTYLVLPTTIIGCN
jgi:hypothetical protein